MDKRARRSATSRSAAVNASTAGACSPTTGALVILGRALRQSARRDASKLLPGTGASEEEGRPLLRPAEAEAPRRLRTEVVLVTDRSSSECPSKHVPAHSYTLLSNRLLCKGKPVNILDDFELDGKVAIVTRASSGLGVACARALADAGAAVARRAPRTERLAVLRSDIERSCRRAIAVPADVADPLDSSRLRCVRVRAERDGVAAAERPTATQERGRLTRLLDQRLRLRQAGGQFDVKQLVGSSSQ